MNREWLENPFLPQTSKLENHVRLVAILVTVAVVVIAIWAIMYGFRTLRNRSQRRFLAEHDPELLRATDKRIDPKIAELLVARKLENDDLNTKLTQGYETVTNLLADPHVYEIGQHYTPLREWTNDVVSHQRKAITK